MTAVFNNIRRSLSRSPTKVESSARKEVVPQNQFQQREDQIIPRERNEESQLYGYLLIEDRDGSETARFPLRNRVTTVGRLTECDIRIYEAGISRKHCQFNVDDNGEVSLQVFNPRGIRLNQQKIHAVATASGKGNSYPLRSSDLVQILYSRLRLHLAPQSSMSTPRDRAPTIRQKSQRISLVPDESNRVNVVEVNSSPTEQREKGFKGDAEVAKVAIKTFHEDSNEDKENIPFKPRRSFILATPARPRTQQSTWESEPRKKVHQKASLNPVKTVSMQPRQPDLDDEEVNYPYMVIEDDNVGCKAHNGAPETQQQEVCEPQQPPSETHCSKVCPSTPPPLCHKVPSVTSDRLIKSSSPKKTRRRSSFFGRAGLFAGINFGFYPEERKDHEDEKAIESGILAAPLFLASPSSPSRLIQESMPEPPLDLEGRPRLPRSLSSPGGFSGGSPGKRRVMSLRTATLIRSGQHAFEQQKLLSPPSSPPKHISLLSLSPAKHATSAEVEISPEQVPLPESENDTDEEDEVDKSLSSVTDEDPRENPCPPSTSRRGPRKTDVISSTSSIIRTSKGKRPARASMPASLPRPAENEKVGLCFKDWQKDLHVSTCGAISPEHDKEGQSRESTMLVERNLEAVESRKLLDREAQETPGSESRTDAAPSYTMLRHMVRESPDLTALLDDVVRERGGSPLPPEVAETIQEKHVQERNVFGTPVVGSDRPKNDELTCVAGDRVLDTLGKTFVPIPAELSAAASRKLTRRASEAPQKSMHRRKSNMQRIPKMSYRKSAAATIISVDMSMSDVPSITPPEQNMDIPELHAPPFTLGEIEQKQANRDDKLTAKGDILTDGTLAINACDAEERVRSDTKLPQNTLQMLHQASPQRSPRKRALDPANASSPSPVIGRGRAAKTAAKAALSGQAPTLRERQASESPTKASRSRSGGLSASKQPESAAAAKMSAHRTSSDEPLNSSHLLLQSSSPVKRTKRAAKNSAEQKIKATLTKKPSMTVVRDVKSASIPSHSNESGPPTRHTARKNPATAKNIIDSKSGTGLMTRSRAKKDGMRFANGQ